MRRSDHYDDDDHHCGIVEIKGSPLDDEDVAEVASKWRQATGGCRWSTGSSCSKKMMTSEQRIELVLVVLAEAGCNAASAVVIQPTSRVEEPRRPAGPVLGVVGVRDCQGNLGQ